MAQLVHRPGSQPAGNRHRAPPRRTPAAFGAIGEDHDQHESEPIARQGEQGDARRPRARCPPAPRGPPGQARRRCPADSSAAARVPRAAPSRATRRRASPATGRPVAMLVPQSPCTNRPSHAPYCAGSGRSRPSASRWAAIWSGLAARARGASAAGSPGASRSRRNMSVTTPKTTATPASARTARGAQHGGMSWRSRHPAAS